MPGVKRATRAAEVQRVKRIAVVAWSSVALVALAGCLPIGSVEEQQVDPGAGQTGSCSGEAPAGASQAVVEYIAAVTAATPAWLEIDARIRDVGTHRDDLLAQAQADEALLVDVRAITFPPEAADEAARFVAAVEAYDALLMVVYEKNLYLADYAEEDGELNEARAASSSRLRDVLQLPPSNCIFARP